MMSAKYRPYVGFSLYCFMCRATNPCLLLFPCNTTCDTFWEWSTFHGMYCLSFLILSHKPFVSTGYLTHPEAFCLVLIRVSICVRHPLIHLSNMMNFFSRWLSIFFEM